MDDESGAADWSWRFIRRSVLPKLEISALNELKSAHPGCDTHILLAGEAYRQP